MVKLLNKARIFSENISKIDYAITSRSYKKRFSFLLVNCKQTSKKRRCKK